jgi:orotate phosphoribosyltransferase
MLDPLLTLAAARRGHFRLESGHHGELWRDLDPWFLRPTALQPFAQALAGQLAPHHPAAKAGPHGGGAFQAQMIATILDIEFYYAERFAPPPGDTLYAVQYRVPPALRAGLRGKAVAVVDDVISAGSAVRSTLADLRAGGARPVALGALLVMTDAAATFATAQGLPLEHLAQINPGIWLPAECPLCTAGVPLEATA